jgi:hypothetical protein
MQLTAVFDSIGTPSLFFHLPLYPLGQLLFPLRLCLSERLHD